MRDDLPNGGSIQHDNLSKYEKRRSSFRTRCRLAQKRQWVSEAFARLETAGYSITSTCTAVKNPILLNSFIETNCGLGDMIALGVASFGHLGGVHYQNLTHFDQYCESMEASSSVILKGSYDYR